MVGRKGSPINMNTENQDLFEAYRLTDGTRCFFSRASRPSRGLTSSLVPRPENALRERNFTPVSCPIQPAWQQKRSRTTRKYSANCCPTWTLDGSCTLRVARKQTNAYTMYSRRYTPCYRGYKATTPNSPMEHQSKWPRLPTCKKILICACRVLSQLHFQISIPQLVINSVRSEIMQMRLHFSGPSYKTEKNSSAKT